MSMLWPGVLLLLGLIPLILGIYIWMLRRRRRFAMRFSSLALVREALPHRSGLRRHLPFALFLLALSSLVVAAGRPVSFLFVPDGQATIILTMDVSGSMCSTDIQPNRLVAAQDAALSFVQRQDPNTQIGIVVFAGFAAIVQPPTTDQEDLEYAIDGLTTARRTAVGSGILKALEAIAEVNSSVASLVSDSSSEDQPTPVPKGTYVPDIIVLLTDGASNAGPHPLDAAQQAADRGVRVYTIGFGTANGSYMDCGRRSLGGSFGGGSQSGGNQMFGGGGGGFRRGIDEETLKEVSAMTGGKYYSASSAMQLQSVFEGLPTYLITRKETMEISVAFTALGALLAALAILLAMIWHPLP